MPLLRLHAGVVFENNATPVNDDDAVGGRISDILFQRPACATHHHFEIRYVRALASAFAFIRDPGNRAAVIAVVVDDTRCSVADAAATLDLYFKPERNVLPQRGEIDRAAMARTIAMMGDVGQIAPPLPAAERFLATQYLRAAGIE